jgi:hypothetical protein
MAKKKQNLEPRRKRFKREDRLQSAKSWLKGYDGKNVIRSYSKWFAVDQICALKELELLGLCFSDKQKTKVKEVYENRIRQKQLLKARKLQRNLEREYEEYFKGVEFIEDFTEGCAQFGLAYWEHEEIEAEEREREEMVKSLTDLSLYWVDEQLKCKQISTFWEDDDEELP